MASDSVFLFDTNAIIEAVRTGVWNAVSGGLTIETVDEVREECRRGDHLSSGYVVVSGAELARMSRVHAVAEIDRSSLAIANARAGGMHPGERDLYAYAYRVRDQEDWLVCSPDIAAVKSAVELGWRDRLVSLEEACKRVGENPAELRDNFTSRWLSKECTKALLGL